MSDDVKTHLAVGLKLRNRRKVRGLSLQDVALRSGMSIGKLSQIERGISTPSLRSLTQICSILDMPVGWLFEAQESSVDPVHGCVISEQARRRIDLGAKGMVKELMTPDACTHLQMMKVIVQPGGSSGTEPYSARGLAESGTVLNGRMWLELDGRMFSVSTGDTFTYEAPKQVRFWCNDDEGCEVIWTVTPTLY